MDATKTNMDESNIRKIRDETKANIDGNSRVRLIFMGAPLLDISAKGSDQLLEQYGLMADDCVIAKKEHDPLFQQLFLNSDSHLAAGGSAQNSARIAKWTLEDKGEVVITGCTGCDEYETWMRRKLLAEGLVPLYMKIPSESTGTCACLLTQNGQRSMCCRQGAAAKFATEHLQRNPVHQHLERSHCIFIEGYFIVHSPEVVISVAENHRPNQIFSFSLSAEYVCRSNVKALLKVIPNVDILFGNEAEVKTFSRVITGEENISVEEAVREVRHLQTSNSSFSKPRILVITRGDKPIVVVDESNNFRSFDIPTGIPVVDSVGCGDALAGAFLATYILTGDLNLSIMEGIKAATQIVQVHGCDPPIKRVQHQTFGCNNEDVFVM